MSYDLLDTAEHLLSRVGGPTHADACRSVSTIYYALFHCMAKNCSDLFVSNISSGQLSRAWNHLYRALDHRGIEQRCRKIDRMRLRDFPQELIDFADFVRTMMWKRERCDYAYGVTPTIGIVLSDIAVARDFLGKFASVSDLHRRAFAVYVLVADDRHEKKLINV